MSEIPSEWERLHDLGFALHYLKPKSKIPVKPWTKGKRADLKTLKREYRPVYNAGVRLGSASKIDGYYLAVLDLDVKDPAKEKEALNTLYSLYPETKDGPYLLSGRGNGSRHHYVRLKEPVSGNEIKARGDGWEIQLLSEGRQAVIVESVHPITGATYKWGKAVNGSGKDIPIIDPGPGAVKPSTKGKTRFKVEYEDVDLSELPITQETKDWIAHGVGSPAGDRSADLLAVSMSMMRKDIPDRAIRGVLTNPNYHLGRAAMDRRNNNRESAVEWLEEHTLKTARKKISEDVFDADEKKAAEGNPAHGQNVKGYGKDSTTGDQAVELLNYVKFSEIEFSGPSLTLVDGLLAETGLSLIFGPSGSGKTFLALYLAWCIASGRSFFGRAVKQCPVVFVAAESPGVTLQRFFGVKHCNNIDDIPLIVITGGVTLFQDKNAVRALIKTIQNFLPDDSENLVIFFDTFNAVAGSADENCARDTGQIVLVLKEIEESLGIKVQQITVHHSPFANEAKPRGSTAFYAAMDTVINVRSMSAEVLKHRNGLEGDKFSFGLDIVPVSDDFFDGQVPILIEKPNAIIEVKRTKLRKGSVAEKCLQVLRSLAKQGNQMRVSDWREAFRKKHYDGKPKTTCYDAFTRSRETLTENGWIEDGGEYVSLCDD